MYVYLLIFEFCADGEAGRANEALLQEMDLSTYYHQSDGKAERQDEVYCKMYM